MLTFLCVTGICAMVVMLTVVCRVHVTRDRKAQEQTIVIMQSMTTVKHAIKYLEDYGSGLNLEYTRARVILHNSLEQMASELPIG